MVYTDVKQLFPRLYEIADFGGQKIEIPFAEEDDYRYFLLDQVEETKRYYAENGYVVLRGLLPSTCAIAPTHRLKPRSSLSAASSTGRRAPIPNGMYLRMKDLC